MVGRSIPARGAINDPISAIWSRFPALPERVMGGGRMESPSATPWDCIALVDEGPGNHWDEVRAWFERPVDLGFTGRDFLGDDDGHFHSLSCAYPCDRIVYGFPIGCGLWGDSGVEPTSVSEMVLYCSATHLLHAEPTSSLTAISTWISTRPRCALRSSHRTWKTRNQPRN